jgi:hypothetical protein
LFLILSTNTILSMTFFKSSCNWRHSEVGLAERKGSVGDKKHWLRGDESDKKSQKVVDDLGVFRE